MIETSDYWILNDKFIFGPEFDSSIQAYINLISQSNELIFSNYDDVNICINTNNNYDSYYDSNYGKNYQESKFNQKIELP